MVFNATFNNMSVIWWQSVLLVEVAGENHHKKRRRTGQLSTYDVAMAIHPCLIKRPSIILPEVMEDVRKKIKHTNTILEDLNLSDSEG
jgi:hypothetical protein